MKLHYNATGPDRKELVQTISKLLGIKPVYKGMPTSAYEVGTITVEKDGTVVYDERTDQDTIEAVIIALAAAGFSPETGTDEQEGPTGVAIQMPLSIFTDDTIKVAGRISRTDCTNSSSSPSHVKVTCASSEPPMTLAVRAISSAFFTSSRIA